MSRLHDIGSYEYFLAGEPADRRRDHQPVDPPLTKMEIRATDYFNALNAIILECDKPDGELAERIKAIAWEGLKRAWA